MCVEKLNKIRIWSQARCELNKCFNFRYTIREQVLDDGMVSELGIMHTFRHDTGVYICQASNSFGQVR